MMVNEDWRDKLEAQQRHEQLAAAIRIATGELCYLAEQINDLPTAERLYGISDFLDGRVREAAVAYDTPVPEQEQQDA